MEEQTKKLLIRSAIIGGVVGGAVVGIKSKMKIGSCMTKYYRTTTEILTFLNENRSEIIEQVKNTSDKVTKVIDATNHDLKALSDNIKHLKNSSSEMISTVQQTKGQLLGMYESCKKTYEEEKLSQNLEVDKDA